MKITNNLIFKNKCAFFPIMFNAWNYFQPFSNRCGSKTKGITVFSLNHIIIITKAIINCPKIGP